MQRRLLGIVGNTAHNLKDAAAGEHYEWSEMYRSFELVARKRVSMKSPISST